MKSVIALMLALAAAPAVAAAAPAKQRPIGVNPPYAQCGPAANKVSATQPTTGLCNSPDIAHVLTAASDHWIWVCHQSAKYPVICGANKK